MSFFLNLSLPVTDDNFLRWGVFLNIVFFGVFFITYILRDIPGFDVLYKIIRALWRLMLLFFLVFFATLGINFIKKEVKSWWND
jgi:hypothetical protein